MSRARLLTGVALLVLGLALGSLLASALGNAPRAVPGLGGHFEVLDPAYLGAIAAVLLLAWASHGSLADLPRPQRLLSLLLRALALSTMVLALARLSRVEDATRISAVMLVDVSDSVGDPDLQRARELVQHAEKARGGNDLQLVTFAARPARVAAPEDGSLAQAIARQPGGGSESNLQAALQLAYGLFPAGHIKRVALLSDGLQTRGDLLTEVSRARGFGVRLTHHALAGGAPHEVAVRELSLPDAPQVGQSFDVRATIFASKPGKARVRLYQGEVLGGLDAVRELDLAAGDNSVSFRSVLRVPGPARYRIEVEPLGPDHFAENNSVTTTVVALGRPRVLIVDSAPAQARHLADALGSGEFDVDVLPPSALPRSLGEAARYDFFILSDVPAEAVGAEPMGVIERYVRDHGGGFMMAGGDQSFGLGGYQRTAMERLLPVRMDSQRRRDEQSLALALVIDTSGSMAGMKMELAKDAAKAAAEVLGASDSLGVVGFSSSPERKVRMQSAQNRLRIGRNIGQLMARGGTAIFPALDMAFGDLLGVRARVKHMILLTDGQTQEQGIPELVRAMRAEGITISTVGLGTDVNRSLLQESANLGGGRAYFTNDPHNVPRIFTRETTTVGRNSAVEDLIAATPITPADFLKGLDMGSAPYLRGYVATEAKPTPAQVIVASDLGEPLLARWRVGLGWSLAWTSDIKSRWSTDWLRWRGFARFWGQLVREHMRRKHDTELPLQARLERGEVVVVADAIGPDDRFINGMESTLTIADSGGGGFEERHAMRQTAPGRYETRFPLERYGSFSLSALHRLDGRTAGIGHARLDRPYPREYAATEADLALLSRASELGGGGPLDVERLFDRRGEHVRGHQALWPQLLLLTIALLLLDLLLRRLRLWDRNFRSGTQV
ncbi:MAG: VWA domain-containing protein [Myxococcales bacterium]|nr:VWA domain-containing protein [Myxococcales bacterium]